LQRPGLSISRGVVEEHGGKIEAKNNTDGGAGFLVRISHGQKQRGL
jgi:K+-sensing histidine kinase KdpD